MRVRTVLRYGTVVASRHVGVAHRRRGRRGAARRKAAAQAVGVRLTECHDGTRSWVAGGQRGPESVTVVGDRLTGAAVRISP